MPRREWLAIVLPVALAGVLLVDAFARTAARTNGWLVVIACFAVSAAVPLAYSLVLLREGRLFLRGADEIERNRVRVGRSRMTAWAVAPALAIGAGALTGMAQAALLASVAGVLFGLWPGILANFVRLRREHHWG